ncbi:MAG: hypothetical protein JSU83_06260 [Deltaproteobacteria bacterium]|nr:MAG: hypothetical protein JSU83_06260 [Deltaproteobacteria bacterium]
MRHIPLLAVILVAYNIVAFFYSAWLNQVLWQITLMSGAVWRYTGNDLLLSLAVVLLYLELFKATKTSVASVLDHGLSLAIFIVFLLEFALVPEVGNSAFMIIMLISLLDVVAGFTITISTARRDFGIGGHAVS